jgi:hypothetical protein
MRYLNHKKEGGYIALMSVIIAGVVAVSVTVSLLMLGFGASRTSFSLEQSAVARSLASACVEEGLQQIRDSTPYSGFNTLNLVSGDCSYEVINDGGQDRTINASSTVGQVVRREQVIIDAINPEINITFWQEVLSF